MKKITLLVIIAIITFGQTVNAQETEFNPLNHPNEFYLEYGDSGLVWGVGGALASGMADLGWNITESFFSKITGKTYTTKTKIKLKPYGVATLSFQHKFKKAKWLGLGADLSYLYYKILAVTGEQRTPKGYIHCITPMVALNFYYLQRKHIELYSGLSVGATFMVDDKATTTVGFAGHLTTFALSAGGKHVRYHCELGMGMKGFINMGIGYKF